MMDEDKKSQLLAQFGGYLDNCVADGGDEEANQTDLFSLFVELAALRTEVRTESRQFGNALEQFKEAQSLLRNSHEHLERELERSRNDMASLRRAALRPLLVELLELHL